MNAQDISTDGDENPHAGEAAHREDRAEMRELTVVVGISDTSTSAAALHWGLHQLDLHGGGRVLAVRAWRPRSLATGTASPRVPQTAEIEAQERVRLSADVASVVGHDPRVETHLVRGTPSDVLVEASRGAHLLVLDAPRAPVTRPLLAPSVVYRLDCPVVMMPPSISGEPPRPWERLLASAGRAMLRSAGQAGRPGLGRRGL